MPAAAVVAFAGLVALLAVLAWWLLADDEHLADTDPDEADRDRAHGGGW